MYAREINTFACAINMSACEQHARVYLWLGSITTHANFITFGKIYYTKISNV